MNSVYSPAHTTQMNKTAAAWCHRCWLPHRRLCTLEKETIQLNKILMCLNQRHILTSIAGMGDALDGDIIDDGSGRSRTS